MNADFVKLQTMTTSWNMGNTEKVFFKGKGRRLIPLDLL